MSASLVAEGVGGFLDKGIELEGAETSPLDASKKLPPLASQTPS